MEGAPRVPMYSFQIKTSSMPMEVDQLKSYLESEYGESSSSYDTEFKALLDLRKSALEAPQDLGGLSLMKKYYGQLQYLKSRFPMEECESCALPVSWDDLYIDDAVTHSDIRFEEAAVLYNIGALESILGCKESRSEADGIKSACTHFMSAAWCFQRVSEVFSGAVAPDLEAELMRLKAQMMLAQAQECVFLKSQLDGRKSGINARIAQQLVDFYGQVAGLLTPAGIVAKVIPSRTRKHYVGIFAVKRSFYEAQVAFYSAQSCEDTGQYGLRLAWLVKAKEALQAALTANKDLKDAEMRETLAFVQDVVVGKHESADRDNGLIYHAQVPQSVPDVQAAQLVKPLPFDPAEPAGPDLFKRLVPLKTSEASSVYSEEVSKKLRQLGESVEAKDTELAECLSSLQADPEFYSVSADAALPQLLYDACAQLSVGGDAAHKELTQRMQQLASVAADVDSQLALLKELLAQPAAATPATAASLRPFAEDLARCERVAREAQPSNDSLRASASRYAESLAELRKSPDALRDSLPTVTDLQSDESLHQRVAELRRLLGKVDEMRQQRADLLTSVRTDLRSEDATTLLLRQPSQDPVQLFQASLDKQRDRLTYLDQNLAAQANILAALIDTHAQLASQRELISQRRVSREQAVQRLVTAWSEGPALLAKVQEGTHFFTGLLRKLKVIEARVKPLIVPPPQPPPQPQLPQASSRRPLKAADQSSVDTNDDDNNGRLSASAAAAAAAASASGSGSGGGGGPPRLKDYLPFMKPGTYGGAQRSTGTATTASIGSGSLPASPLRGGFSSQLPQPPQLHHQQQPQQLQQQFQQMPYGRHSPLPNQQQPPQPQPLQQHQPAASFGSQQSLPSSLGYAGAAASYQPPSSSSGGTFGSSQYPGGSAAGSQHHPPSSSGNYGPQHPPSSSGTFGPQHPPSSSGTFGPQHPPSSSGNYGPQHPPSSSGNYGPQHPPSSSGNYGPQHPPSSSGNYGPQHPPSSSGNYGPQHPPSSIGNYGPQHPPSSVSHSFASSTFPTQQPVQQQQQHHPASIAFPQQPSMATGNQAPHQRQQQFPQQQQQHQQQPPQTPWMPQGFSQQPGSATSGFSQQPGSAASGFSQQPGSAASGFSQQPGSLAGVYRQQPGGASSGFPQQPTIRPSGPSQPPPPHTAAGGLHQQFSTQASLGQQQQQQQPQSTVTRPSQFPPQHLSGAGVPSGFSQQSGTSGATGQGFPQQPSGTSGATGSGFPQQYSGTSRATGPGFPQQPSVTSGATGSGFPQQQGTSGSTGQGFPQQQGTSGSTVSGFPQQQSGTSGSTGQGFLQQQSGTSRATVQGFPQQQSGTSGATGQGFPQQQSGTSGATGQGFPQQQGTSGSTGQGFPQQQSGTSGATGQEFPQQQSGTSGATVQGFPQQQSGTSGATGSGFPQQQSGTSGATGSGFPQQQSGTSGATGSGFPKQYTGTSGATGQGFSQQLSTSGATGSGFPQQQSGTSGATGSRFPQQYPGTSGFPQQSSTSGATGQGFPQQPSGTSGAPASGFPQQSAPTAGTPTAGFPQQPGATHSVGPQQQSVAAATTPGSAGNSQQQQQQQQQQRRPSDSQASSTSNNSSPLQRQKNNNSNSGITSTTNSSSTSATQQSAAAAGSAASLLDSDDAVGAAAVLTPSVLTTAERELQVAEAALRRQSGVDRLSDNLLFNQLIADTERLGRRLPATDVWPQFQTALRALTDTAGRRPATVAMCHPMQNRSPECVPYDYNRVRVGDDSAYVNASLVQWQSTRLILAQQPTRAQLSAFYRMLLQHGCELLCQLGAPAGGQTYWPDAKGEAAAYGQAEVAVRAVHPGDSGLTERVIAVKVGDAASRTLVMLQVHSDYPAAVERACQVLSDQRSPLRPVCLVCPDGSARCGLFAALLVARHQLKLEGRMPPLVDIAASLASQRPCVLSDPQQLQHLYANFHEVCQILLRKKGVLVRQSSATSAQQQASAARSEKSPTHGAESTSGEATPSADASNGAAVSASSHQRQPSKDFLQSLDAKNIRIEPVPEDKRRIRKEDFAAAGAGGSRDKKLKPEQVPNDPFSSLDPLWSHHGGGSSKQQAAADK